MALESYLGSRITDLEYIKSHFSEIVDKVQVDAYNSYRELEAATGAEAIDALVVAAEQLAGHAGVRQFLRKNFFGFDRYFLRLTQSRRSRAGSALEEIVSQLFGHLKYPYTPKPDLGNSKPDYVLPSLNYYEANAPDCVIFTCKRTVRERWRQIVTEGATGRMFYLGTIDEGLSVAELQRMKDRNVMVVVPALLKAGKYSKALNVISFEDFFEDVLDPAMARWRRSGVVS